MCLHGQPFILSSFLPLSIQGIQPVVLLVHMPEHHPVPVLLRAHLRSCLRFLKDLRI